MWHLTPPEAGTTYADKASFADNVNAILTIPNPTDADDGAYTCTFNFAAGISVTAEFSVKVERK